MLDPGEIDCRSTRAQLGDAGLAASCSLGRAGSTALHTGKYSSPLDDRGCAHASFIDLAGADLGIHLDSYHMNIEENGLAEPIAVAGERLTYVHVGESHRGYLGTGTVNFPQDVRPCHRRRLHQCHEVP